MSEREDEHFDIDDEFLGEAEESHEFDPLLERAERRPKASRGGQARQGGLEPCRGRARRAAVGKRAARHLRRRLTPLRANQPWVVLKFGGTSVSSPGNWHNIVGVLKIAHGRGPAPGRRAFRAVGHHRSPRVAARGGRGRHPYAPFSSGSRPCTATSRSVCAIVPCAALRGLSRGSEAHGRQRGREPRGQRSNARAGHGDGRADGDRVGRGLFECAGHRDGLGRMRAKCCAPSSATVRPLKAGLLSATCDFAPDAELQARWRRARAGRDHAGLHCRQ